MAERDSKILSSDLHETKVSEEKIGNARAMEELDLYFTLAQDCLKAVQNMSSLKLNIEQCGYLVDKLEMAVRSASSFVEMLRAEQLGLGSIVDIAKQVEIFKLQLTLAKQIEDFVQGCCKDSWIQAAMTLTNVSHYVASVGFHLELCRVAFCRQCATAGRLSLDDVEVINKAECVIVEEKASADVDTLFNKVVSVMPSLSSENQDLILASYLIQRLKQVKPILSSDIGGLSSGSDDGGILRKLFTWVNTAGQLGRGASATVEKAMWLGTQVAKKTFFGTDNPDFMKEAEILSTLCHPNITSMFCCGKTGRSCSIIMELMDEDLHTHMQRRLEENGHPPFPILEAVDIMLQIGEGVKYLHNQRIVHRDLKSMNILIRSVKGEKAQGEYVHVKLADFGLSRTKERSTRYSNMTYNIGTNRWMPPEIIKLVLRGNQESSLVSIAGPQYPMMCDTYSFGMVCFEILTGDVPFPTIYAPNEVKKKIMEGERPTLPTDCPSILRALIEKCWNYNPRVRPAFVAICSELKYLKYLLMRVSVLGDELRACEDQSVPGLEVQVQFQSDSSSDSKCVELPDPITLPRGETVQEIAEPRLNHGGNSYSEEVWETCEDLVPHNDPQRPRIKWVICLDFGTTHSGFAYANLRYLRGGPIYAYYHWPSEIDRRHISLSRRTDSSLTPKKPYDCKTLTQLYYKEAWPGHSNGTSWGHFMHSDYLDHHGSQRGGQGFFLTKFKLLLMKDLNDTELAKSIPSPLSATDIITEYLKLIGELALSTIRNHNGSLRRDSVQWCVTVPSIWDDSAKQQMKACMVNTGLVSAEAGGTDVVKVVLEPEAASFYCLQMFRENRLRVSLQAKEKILVADVGGGLVDIVVQEVVGSKVDENYQLKELTESSGGLCGGTSIDESFLRFMSKKIGCLDEFFRKDNPSYKTRLLMDWEEIKFSFCDETMSYTDREEITLHPKLAQKWEAYERERGNAIVDSTVVQLTKQDLKSFFDPVVDQILELIVAQLSQVPGIKVMFIVGGLARSSYLMHRIRAHFSREVIRDIVSPPDPGRAVVKGAISLALRPNAILSRVLKKTYGTSVILPFDDGIDPLQLLKVINGVEYCRNRFDVFVKKGSRVGVETCLTKSYVPHGQTHMVFSLYSSTEEDPRYTEGASVTKEGEYYFSLPEIYSMDKLPKVSVSMFFGGTTIELKAEVVYSRMEGVKLTRRMVLPVEYCS